MRALIVGFGKMGMLHAATLNAHEAVEEIVICEPSGFVADGVRSLHPRLKVYRDPAEALGKERIDLAVIATPNHTHFPIFKELFPRGIHLFIEKPFVAGLDEARAAYGLCRRDASQKTKVMIGHCLRFAFTFARAKEYLEKKALGRILHFEARMFSSDVESAESGWRFDKDHAGGGVLLDLGTHLVDLARFFFGMPRTLAGHTESWYSKNVEDYFQGVFHYPGFSGTMEGSWSVPNIRKPAAEFFITGENGTLAVTHDRLDLFLKKSASGEPAGFHAEDAVSLGKPVSFDLAGPFYALQLEHWLDSVQKNRPNANGVLDGLQNHELLELIRVSRGVEKKVETLP